MPLDVEANPKGNVLVCLVEDEWGAVEYALVLGQANLANLLAATPEVAKLLYMAHFASCPKRGPSAR